MRLSKEMHKQRVLSKHAFAIANHFHVKNQAPEEDILKALGSLLFAAALYIASLWSHRAENGKQDNKRNVRARTRRTSLTCFSDTYAHKKKEKEEEASWAGAILSS